MADLIITASQVLPGADSAGATFENGVAGATITAGQSVYLDSATNTLKLADNNDTSALLAIVRGIALHGSTTGQPLRIQTSGPMTIGAGAAPVVSRPYVLSATPGGIAPVADLATGNRTTIIGIGSASGGLILRLWASQQVAP